MTRQSAFSLAILDPGMPGPEGLSDPQGRPAGRRFDVYRNNVTVALREALETGFPVLRKLLGAEYFGALATEYLRKHPPSSPLMMVYGEEMPEFLADFPPVSHLPYLPDVARLEIALRQSYHAEDAPAFAASAFASLPPAELELVRLHLAPSTRLLRSPWPLYGLWAYNTIDGAPKPQMRHEDVLVTRPAFDPTPQLLPPGAAVFIEVLSTGKTLETAADAAANATDGFDLTTALGTLLSSGALTRFTTKEL